jgi:hypothetical protein
MSIKTAIALAIIVGTASGAQARTNQSGNLNWGAYDCPGTYVGSNPKTLINRPQNGLCDASESSARRRT